MNAPAHRRLFYFRAKIGWIANPELGYVKDALSLTIGHFYVDSPDDIDAGAWAHDYCAEQGLVFLEYLSLPKEITQEQIRDFEPEHHDAYALAMNSGYAVVISVVLGELKAARARIAQRTAEDI